MGRMMVIADENMPCAEAFFSRLGDVRLAPGRAITPAMTRQADLLMVRSITKVGAVLLEGSRVRFVGTATIGTDHLDLAWLAAKGIVAASAPGCNAESVAQYMAAALAWTSWRRGRPLSEQSIGVVGVGNCGSRVARVAAALGMRVVLNDPPLARQAGDPKYRPLDELMDCDYVALHVPLTREGEDKTWRLFDAERLAKLKPGSILINACRGGVVDEATLRGMLDSGRLFGAILDAWEGEPAINLETAARVLLGTPHIAGYSHDGKVNGTRMVYEAACRTLGQAIEKIDVPMPAAAVERIALECRGRRLDSVMAELILRAYPIDRDDADLRTACASERETERGTRNAELETTACAREGAMGIGPAFDALRKNYPLRREFAATRVRLQGAPDSWPPDWPRRVADLGFAVEEPASPGAASALA